MQIRYFAVLLTAVSNLAFAQVCIDTDGDGWGWNGVESCLVDADAQAASTCIDTPPVGDTWGWDGSQSCRVGVIESFEVIAPIAIDDPGVGESVCIDTGLLGDGWGWDGRQSCRIDTPEAEAEAEAPVTGAVCFDSAPVGDGWGWDGVQSCRIAVSAPDAIEFLPSGGHVSNPQFQWPSVADAGSYQLIIEDHLGDRISQEFTAGEAACSDASGCSVRPSVQIHDSILNWRVQAFGANGNLLETSQDVDFNTVRSLTAQPYTDRDNIGAPPNPGNGFPTIEFDQFIVLNNPWNAGAMFRDDWQQTVAVDRLANGNAKIVIEYDWLARSDGDEFAVKSYPQIVYGSKLGAHVSGTRAELGLPETISNLEEFRIDYSFTETGNAERNLAFESFFHSDCEINGPNFDVDDREYEMMVWIANPSIRTPGTIRAETGVLIDNQLWDVWIKPSQNDEYIAFTAINEVSTGTLNWNRFVDWTVSWSRTNQSVYNVKALNTDWCMSAIEFGPETFWGSSRLVIDELRISRQ